MEKKKKKERKRSPRPTIQARIQQDKGKKTPFIISMNIKYWPCKIFFTKDTEIYRTAGDNINE